MNSNVLVAVLYLLVVVYLVEGLNNFDYCQHECNNGYKTIKHVVCEREPSNCGPHKRCNNFVQVNITKSLQDFIVNEHNKYRNKVALGLERRGTDGPQPSASNMKEFRYNEELGYIAQCWANTCQIQKHSYCNKASNLPFVGQNMALRSYSWPEGVTDLEMNIKLMVAAWYDEVALFNYKFVPRFEFELSYGHYTQMIWGTSEEVGCGISLYTSNGWYHIFLVCDYGSRIPSGNILNYEVYKIGKPCSQCPRGTVCNSEYKGLCSIPKKTEHTNATIIKNPNNIIHDYATNFTHPTNYLNNKSTNKIIQSNLTKLWSFALLISIHISCVFLLK